MAGGGFRSNCCDGQIKSREHRREIGDGSPHIAQDLAQRCFDFWSGRLRAELADLKMDEAFARDAVGQGAAGLRAVSMPFAVAPHFKNGMSDKLRHKVEIAKAPKHGVEKKGHVVVDDVDNKKLRLTDEALPERDLGLARLSLTEALESVRSKSDKVARLVGFEFRGIDFVEKAVSRNGLQGRPPFAGKEIGRSPIAGSYWRFQLIMPCCCSTRVRNY